MFRYEALNFIRKIKTFFLRSIPPYLKKTISIKKLKLGGKQIQAIDDITLYHRCHQAIALLRSTEEDFDLQYETSGLSKMLHSFEQFLRNYHQVGDNIIHKKQYSADLMVQIIHHSQSDAPKENTQNLLNQLKDLGDSSLIQKAKMLMISPEDHS